MTTPTVARRSPVLVTDGDCGFCQATVRQMQRRIKRLPEIVQFQHVDLAALGLTEAECTIELKFVAVDGRIDGGHRAAARTLIFAGKGWQILGRLLLVPGVSWVAALAYRWIAANRYRLPGASGACAIPVRQDSRSDTH